MKRPKAPGMEVFDRDNQNLCTLGLARYFRCLTHTVHACNPSEECLKVDKSYPGFAGPSK